MTFRNCPIATVQSSSSAAATGEPVSSAWRRTMRSTSSRRSGGRVNLQQQLTPRLIANVTANYINTANQFQAFGEQNDYGIMGSLFFAPTNVDFRPTNGIYPLPPSLGTNPLLAIDRRGLTWMSVSFPDGSFVGVHNEPATGGFVGIVSRVGDRAENAPLGDVQGKDHDGRHERRQDLREQR